MTEQTPPPQPQQYRPAPARPPLSPELKRKASVAGAVSFTVMSIGWSLFSTAVGVGLFTAFFAWLLNMSLAAEPGRDGNYLRILEAFAIMDPAPWTLLLVAVGLVGAGLWVWSLFISRGKLARAGHPSAWGVTWAGAGIAVAASWFVSWIAWLPMQVMSFVAPTGFDTWESGLVVAIGLGLVSLLVGLAITAVLGWFAWWWMAHAMRPRAPIVG